MNKEARATLRSTRGEEGSFLSTTATSVRTGFGRVEGRDVVVMGRHWASDSRAGTGGVTGRINWLCGTSGSLTAGGRGVIWADGMESRVGDDNLPSKEITADHSSQ